MEKISPKCDVLFRHVNYINAFAVGIVFGGHSARGRHWHVMVFRFIMVNAEMACLSGHRSSEAVHPSGRLAVRPSVYLSVYLSVCLYGDRTSTVSDTKSHVSGTEITRHLNSPLLAFLI